MSSLPSDISSLLIPMQGRPWLVPNIVVAEVVPLRQPDRPGHGPVCRSCRRRQFLPALGV